jgi:hypothetical protein
VPLFSISLWRSHICSLPPFCLSSLVGFISAQTLPIPVFLRKSTKISVVDLFCRNCDEIMIWTCDCILNAQNESGSGDKIIRIWIKWTSFIDRAFQVADRYESITCVDRRTVILVQLIPSCRMSCVDSSIFNKELAPWWWNNRVFRESLFTTTKAWKNHLIGLFARRNEVICAAPTRITLDAARKTEQSYDPGGLPQLDSWRGIPSIGFRCRPLKWWRGTLGEKDVGSETEKDTPMPRLSPAVERGTIERNLMTLGFPPRTIRLLLSHSDFPTFEFRTQQIRFLNQWTRETLNRTIDLSELSTLFDVTDRAVRAVLAWGPEDPLPWERHHALDADIESSLITMLLDAFQRSEPMDNKELLKTASPRYNSKLTKGWVHSLGGILTCCKNAARFHWKTPH